MDKVLKFDTKCSICDNFRVFKNSIDGFCAIRSFGDSKHGLNSYLISPEKSNSTLANNVDAIIRHMVLHQSGQLLDHETGKYHIAHAICRAGMLLTTAYREILGKVGYPNSKRLSNFSLYLYKSVTPELLIMLSKDYTHAGDVSPSKLKDIPNEVLEEYLITSINIHLVTMAEYVTAETLIEKDQCWSEITPEVLLNKITIYDKLFYTLSILYNHVLTKETTIEEKNN